MTSRLDSPNGIRQSGANAREPLAVIGIGCRLPGGIDSPTTFWDALLRGIDAICDVPADRWRHSRFHDTNPEKSGCIRNAKGGFIEGVDQFDGEFFGYFPTEAQRIDPQQRLLLEVTHEAMEDAGLRRDQLDSSRTAVFIGSFMYDYFCMQAASEQRDEINPYVAMGNALCSLANRISYDFNLKGPSVSLDTACSASLTALHLACQSVWGGEAEMAIAGGVNLMLRPEASIMLSKAGFLSPDQYCKAFDDSANGYVRSEGAGVVVLKPLNKAIADGDEIYACVRATAANQDGFLPEGYTVPNLMSQVALLESAYAQAGIDPLTVDYVEAHGTGTPVGDPVEASALGSVLGFARTPAQPNLLIGSVKTNLGHLEGASGIAGFIKAVLTAKYGKVPPNLHFNKPNPTIPWEHYRLQVPTKPTPLDSGDRPLTVGVNSFGAGGANAHVVLQQLTAEFAHGRERPTATNGAASATTTLYAISAAHYDSLRTLALRHADLLKTPGASLDDVAFSAFTRRSHYKHLLAVVGENAEDIAGRLRRFASGEVDQETLSATVTTRKNPKLAFIFSGQGGQWARMGLQLLRRETVFRESMEEIDDLFRQLADWSLFAELEKEDDESRINDTVVVQPAVMAIQISLVKLYEHYGIRPSGVVGHSIGEVAAAFASGAMTLKQAVEVIFHRSQAQDLVSGKGGMLAVGLAPEEAEELVGRYGGKVSIGAVNGPKMLTLSGDTLPLQQIAAKLESRGVFNRPVRVQVPYHSHYIDSIEGIMLDALAHAQGTETTTQLYSTVTGKRERGTHLNAIYWFQNAREPVLFTKAMSAMLQDRFDTFVEIGPHPVLVRGGEDLIDSRGANAVIAPSMTRRQPEATVFLQSLAVLAARGIAPDAKALYGSDRRYIRLPKYPWQHNRYWFESPALAETRLGKFEHPFLKRHTKLATEEGPAVWDATLDIHKFPWFRDHEVDGEIVFPATGHIELAWAAASEQYRHETFFLENLHFDSPLILPDASRHPLDTRLEIVSAEGDYRICSRSVDESSEARWSQHSSGRVNTAHDRFEKSKVSLADVRWLRDENNELEVESFYDTIRAAGLSYGKRFQGIRRLWQREQEMLAQVELPAELEDESGRTFVHPALLDACIHVNFAFVHSSGDPQRVFLPYLINRVRIHRRPKRNIWSYVRVTKVEEKEITFETLVFDEDGELVAEILGLTCRRLSSSGTQPADAIYEGCYEYRWTLSPRDTQLHGRNFDYTTAAIIVPDVQCPEEQRAVAELATKLDNHGLHPHIIEAGPDDFFDELLAEIPLDRRTLIVFAAGMARRESSWRGLAECPSVPSLLHLAQTLHRNEGVPRLCVITRGAAGLDDDRPLDLGQAILHGMSRVINNECPNIPLAVVDLSDSMTPIEVDSLVAELLHSRRDRDESEICLRGEQRYVRELQAVEREAAEEAASSEEEGIGGNYRAEVPLPGALDQIVFRRIPPVELADNDIDIAVQAAALNFKDVVNSMGLLPANAVAGGLAESRIGFEVAGRVLGTGRLVEHIKAGDDVLARVADGFSGRVTAHAHCVSHRPSQLTALQSAAIPVVYVTAWYSLCYLARMARGETVLIHSAAGGVGCAAIQLAQRAGAAVIATAGTKEKRQFVRDMGVEHVFDSRSLDFANDVLEATDGRGVDIVLNSLTGRFITQSMKCLAPFGRFIELGKLDIYRNNKLGLERLGENISLFVVDIDRFATQKPELQQQALAEVVAMFERGELQPTELTEFPISKLTEALRFMTRSAYHGKIVMDMQRDRVRALPLRSLSIRKNRSYVISGGASGFGLEVARWLVDCGARHLVLVSRSGCKTDKDKATVEGMRDRGVAFEMAHADITDASAIRRLVEQIQNSPHPLAGVVHGAAVLDDASIPTMDMARFERAFQPKAQGAWNLHEATFACGAELDFFLMLSSISSTLGLIGQVNYAAANYFQDALARYRQQIDLPATSVNLGVLGDYAGMSNTENDEHDIVGLLESQGMYAMPLPDVLAKLEAALVQQPAQRMMAQLDWPWFRMAYPHLARDARFIDLMSDAAMERSLRLKGTGLRTELAAMDDQEQLERLQQELAAILARILGAEPQRIDVAVSIDKYGLDSLMLTDFQVSIVRAIDINIPLIKLLKGPSVVALSKELVDRLSQEGSEEAKDSQDASQVSEEFTWEDLDGVQVINPWLIRGLGDADATVRLICFHSMGVGASLFTRFLLNPPDDCDIIAVQTPGREDRIDEPLVANVKELVDQIVPNLTSLFDRPVIIWGHSFGGIIAWEVVRRLRELHDCEPAHFVVTGTEAPHEAPKWQKREIMLKAMVQENSADYLLSQSRYVDDPDFFKMILPGMRRDMPLLQTYRFENSSPLECPLTAFAARQDDMVYTDRIGEWSGYTTAGFDLIEVEGDHWFLDRNRELITETLRDIGARFLRAAAKQVVRSPIT